MALYAVENLDDALDATREFLLPFEWRTWWRLALVTFLVAGGSGTGGFPANGFQYSMDGTTAPPGAPPGAPADQAAEFLANNLAVIVGIVGLVLLVGLAFALIAAVMEFVLVESLRSETVHVREYFRRYWGKGLRLFGFRLGIGLTIGLAIAAIVVLMVAPFALGFGGVSVLSLLIFVPVLLLLGFAFGLFFGFTSVFVVPIMMIEDCGVIAGWKHFWPTLRREWRQYAVYAIAGFVLSIVAGFVAGIAVLIPALLLLVPFGIVFGLVFIGTAGSLQIGLAVVVGVLYGLGVLLLVALVQAPIQTYLRYYALLILGDTDESFDVIPEMREKVREAAEGENGENGGEGATPA